MPVILDRQDHAAWLDPAASADRLKSLLKPFSDARMTAYRIDKRVGNVRHDDPGLIEPLADAPGTRFCVSIPVHPPSVSHRQISASSV